MTRFRLLTMIALIFVTMVSLFPPSAAASCVCKGKDGVLHEADGTEGYTDNGECNDYCTSATDADHPEETYASGQVATQETLDALASQDTAAARDTLSDLASQGLGYCYCGDKTNGAQLESDNGQATILDAESCDAVCKAQGKTTVAFGATFAVFPIGNAVCFKESECDAVSGILGSEQPVECEKDYHYCYPEPASASLNVKIGTLEKTVDIGSYISILFTYSLGIAAILAVVMIMIGGAQYVIGSSTGGEAVTAAKTRITNAIIGLVLLLFAYLVLNTVNPALVKFKVLKLPLIKPALFINGSCEDFTKQGYKVKPSGGTCGGQDGTIYQDPSGASMSGTCHFDTCGSEDLLCANNGSSYKCMTCDDGGNSDFLDAGFKPSAANCGSLTPIETAERKDRCVFTSAGNSLTTEILQHLGYDRDYCARIQVQCSQIHSCADYSTYVVASVDESVAGTSGDPVTGAGATNAAEDNGYSEEVKSICADDPCGISATSCSYGDTGCH